MTTIDDKINLFSKMIYDKVNGEKEEQLKKVNEEKEKLIKKEEERIKKLKSDYIKEFTKKANIKENQIISKEKLEMRKEILALRESFINEIIDEAREELVKFTRSDDYENYLISNLEKELSHLEKGRYTIILSKNDEERFEERIKRITNSLKDRLVSIKIDNKIIGGFSIVNDDKHFKIDESLQRKLNEKRDFVGIKIIEALS
ncbi:V-type ATP synthase subunit E [Clostridium fallax]|uniref:V/A-type H+-transporting ATPase subunit E n=1 Tax=Clostridium fallax TaxID=1533 RepID=A0A1M4VV85_9CLOT|nr:V-type ATP synthase subunit E family protein [Clostridium fallax]SHE72763.1 V/A-type H+-transporting ATPase subunit E [Clostridium fallax]SQB07707.1 H+transporting two-sector ATPase E subunit [Clostridium fallax]